MNCSSRLVYNIFYVKVMAKSFFAVTFRDY